MWNDDEVGYYNRWAVETHRDRSSRLPQAQQGGAKRILDLAPQPRRPRPSLERRPRLSVLERAEFERAESLVGGGESRPQSAGAPRWSSGRLPASEFRWHPAPRRRGGRVRAGPSTAKLTQYSVTTPNTTNSACFRVAAPEHLHAGSQKYSGFVFPAGSADNGINLLEDSRPRHSARAQLSPPGPQARVPTRAFPSRSAGERF